MTKPRVLFGNVITGVAGFLLAAGHFRTFDISLFISTTVGMTSVIASACAINNVFDRDIDIKMKRTKKRAVACGNMAVKPASIFASTLFVLGFAILTFMSTWLVVAIGAAGTIIYVWLYGAISKRRTVHGTLVGSISGAMPILAGYCAVSGQIDVAAAVIFLSLFFWQFATFYSIAIYRKKEYEAANIPLMSVEKGVRSTKFQIFFYTVLFVISTLLLTIFGYTGWIYFTIMALAGAYLIKLATEGLRAMDSNSWARRMFHASIKMLFLFSVMLAAGPWLI